MKKRLKWNWKEEILLIVFSIISVVVNWLKSNFAQLKKSIFLDVTLPPPIPSPLAGQTDLEK